jgi:hypothetical protein
MNKIRKALKKINILLLFISGSSFMVSIMVAMGDESPVYGFNGPSKSDMVFARWLMVVAIVTLILFMLSLDPDKTSQTK